MLRRIALSVAFLVVSSSTLVAQAQATPEQLDAIANASIEQYDKLGDVFVEARGWLKDPNHTVTNKNIKADDVKKLVDDLYAAGALRVYASAIMKDGAKQTAPTMMVVVGGKPDIRTKVYKLMNDFTKAQLTAQGKTALLETFNLIDAGSPIVQLILEY